MVKAYSLKEACALGFHIGHYDPLTKSQVFWNRVLTWFANLVGLQPTFERLELKRLPPGQIDIHQDEVRELEIISEEERAFVEQTLDKPWHGQAVDRSEAGLNYYIELASKYGHCH